MITKERVLRDYAIIKKKALQLHIKNNYEKSLKGIQAAAFLAYNFNYFYVDYTLEEVVVKVGSEIADISCDYQPIEKRYVFYDGFGWDNRALSQQYIRALISWDVEILYILENDRTLDEADDILAELSDYNKATVKVLSDKLKITDKIREVINLTASFKPAKIFIHKTPWDTVALAAFTQFKQAQKYLVNLTDHAFWLGSLGADYFLEFRNYGASVSHFQRGIRKEKILLQPYYPIKKEGVFEGFNFSTEGKILLFTGGNFYKMYGEDDKFFHLLKNALHNNPDTILIVAGWGNRKPFDSFIEEHQLQHRIFFIGNRKDIFEIFKNIDIYIPTYPITGGLMAQFAAMNGKPLVGYTDIQLPSNNLNELISTKHLQLMFNSEDLFQTKLKEFVDHPQLRKTVDKEMKNGICTPEQFSMHLKMLVEHNCNTDPEPQYYEVNIDRFAKIYLDVENNYIKAYSSILFWAFWAYVLKTPLVLLLPSLKHASKILRKKIFKVINDM